jgi:predicted DNA-binding WGR domain protein
MRTLVLGTGSDRKFVIIEVQGARMTVTNGKADGTTRKNAKDLSSEQAALSAADLLARELTGRGYVERSSAPTAGAKSATRGPGVDYKPKAPAPTPVTEVFEDDDDGSPYLVEDDEPAQAEVVQPLQRLATTPPSGTSASETAKPKKNKSKKKKKKRKDGEPKDWTFIVGGSAAGVLLLGLIGYLIAPFFAPATLYGTWQGSRVEYEPSQAMTYTHYRLTLDTKKNAVLTLQQEDTSSGSFSTKGDLLVLHLKGDDPDDGPSDVSFRYRLSGSTLELFEPEKGGKSLVKLIKMSETDAIGGGGAGAEPAGKVAAAAPKISDAADPAADAKLAETEFTAKDGAFSLRPPKGFEAKGGSRPDNTYSWAEFNKGGLRVRIDADVTGSLMNDITAPGASDPDNAYPPVASAHDQNKRKVAEEYTDYKESDGVPFNGSKLGEARIATFTASGGGLIFSPNLKGHRVTFLTGQRRITLMGQAPEDEWKDFEPILLAVARSMRH